MLDTDTIAAIATPPGRGGIGIIRLSGSNARRIGEAICNKPLTPRLATTAAFRNTQQQAIDYGIAIFFAGPASFTGEDVVELQGHGGPVILDMLLETVIRCGARAAEPGEFSKRAFLNDKIDLAQAEAIADLIDASSRQAATTALRSLTGEFSQQINRIAADMLQLRMYVESAIDFPEEEIDFLNDGVIGTKLNALLNQLQQLLANADQGALLKEGIHITLAGAPNAGKSSLLNALAGQESAIVSDIAGTTRDIVKESILIDGIPIHISDTAGIRDSSDVIENLGIERSKQAAQQCDLLLLIVDGSTSELHTERDQLLQQLPDLREKPIILIDNKADISGNTVGINGDTVTISAKQNRGIDALRSAIKQAVNAQDNNETTFLARRRHLDALHQALSYLASGREQLQHYQAGELLAEDLRLSHDALGRITGKISADDLLGVIFSSFCIGK